MNHRSGFYAAVSAGCAVARPARSRFTGLLCSAEYRWTHRVNDSRGGRVSDTQPEERRSERFDRGLDICVEVDEHAGLPDPGALSRRGHFYPTGLSRG